MKPRDHCVDRLAARDGAQQHRVVGVVAAGGRHHDAAAAIRVQDVHVSERDAERLEADAGVGVDFADRLETEADARGEALLAELEPFDAEADALVRLLERGGGLEGAVGRAPEAVHRGGVALLGLFAERQEGTGEPQGQMPRERGARLGRAVVVGRFVEELVGVGLHAVVAQFLGAGAPHPGVEVAPLGRDEAVGHEVAGAALGNRGARGLEPLLELHPAVRPARAGEVSLNFIPPCDQRAQVKSTIVGRPLFQ